MSLMASPQRVFTIYQRLAAEAETIRDFQVAKGEKVSGTVNLLIKGDRNKLLKRWGEEMAELCGVLDGTHDDSYLMECTQVFYWGSLYAVTGGITWDKLPLVDLMQQAALHPSLATPGEVLPQAKRLVELGDTAKPEKCFLMWAACDAIYRRQTPPEDQWSMEQLMEADLQDMKTRTYLQPLIAETEGL